ncbi:MAG: hypothetical protein NTZ16_15640 [Verrucomicrobia bacterium]|nr:hypothetical protein [Verrucomicrobiota bacterium]
MNKYKSEYQLFACSRLLALAVLFAGVVGDSYAAAKTWLGNSDANLATAANWGGTAPVDNDTLTFNAAGSAGTALNNNLVSPTYTAGIVFNGETRSSSARRDSRPS